MATKLYEHPFSPYVQKVKIVAMKERRVRGRGPRRIQRANPIGKTNPRLEVPALVDDGFAIFDSTIILDYVEEKWPAPACCPRHRANARVRMIEDVCDTYYEAINWGLMEVRAWKRVTGDAAKQLEAKASEQTAGVFAWLERELGEANDFNGASFGYGDLSVYPHVRGSIVRAIRQKPERPSPHGPLASKNVPASARRSKLRSSLRFLWISCRRCSSRGAFARQYRDHRLEWMIRSGGVDVVLAGLKKKTIRSSEVS